LSSEKKGTKAQKKEPISKKRETERIGAAISNVPEKRMPNENDKKWNALKVKTRKPLREKGGHGGWC